MNKFFLLTFACINFFSSAAIALSQSGVAGAVLDQQGIAVGGARVRVLSLQNKELKEVISGAAGDFEIYPLDFGDYLLRAVSPGYSDYQLQIHVATGATSQIQIEMVSQGKAPTEMTIKVQAKKNLVSGSSPSSSREVDRKMIEQLPQGDDVKLPKLIASTTPGVVSGPFGQTFIRGNHANIQYQIDGVQLPDSPSSTFGQAFSPRNIDKMEVITGGVPSEYGERLAAVVNIMTKSGSEVPGGNVQLGYGAYNTLTPQANASGSNKAGDFHYYLSAAYTKTSRGLDTPQPKSSTEVTQGGKETVHDDSNANDEFVKLDWQLNNSDKISVIAFNSYSIFQIPNFPSSFGPSNPVFVNSDPFGNAPLHYLPSNTNDAQAENNAYLQTVWKDTLDAHSFLQVAPYYKFSKLKVTNDQANDLFQASYAPNPGDSSSFQTNRSTNNFGLKADYSNRVGDFDLVKVGVQAQQSKTSGSTSVIFQPASGSAVLSADNNANTGWFESFYFQDEHKLSTKLNLNAGVRIDATQFRFADASANDSWVEPRIGLSYLLSPTTKLHVFYGLLFQPAPVENLRDTFQTIAGSTTLTPYDIKAEKDNYYELGISQQFLEQVIAINTYYKRAKNMLDDSQLLNTSIAQPYNFAEGYAYGVEFSINGKISDDWFDYANYSYEIAKGKGLSGGLFASPGVAADYQFLDHVQVHTANAGITYKKERWSWSGQGLFGSGLRTGNSNSQSLPFHVSADTSVGYDFTGDTWLSKSKVSFDLLNILDNVYPITIANGFNGSHYAAGRQFYVRLSKDL